MTPQSRIIAIEGSLAFGDVPLNATKDLSFTMHNHGSGVLTLGDVTGPEALAPLISIVGANAPKDLVTHRHVFRRASDQRRMGRD